TEAKADRGEVADHLEAAGVGNTQVRHNPEEIAAVHHDVAVLRQYLLKLESESARIKRAGRICSLKVPRRVEVGDQLAHGFAVKGFRGGQPLRQRLDQLLGYETCIADHAHIGGKPAADIGAYRIDLDQRHLRKRRTKTRSEKVQA